MKGRKTGACGRETVEAAYNLARRVEQCLGRHCAKACGAWVRRTTITKGFWEPRRRGDEAFVVCENLRKSPGAFGCALKPSESEDDPPALKSFENVERRTSKRKSGSANLDDDGEEYDEDDDAVFFSASATLRCRCSSLLQCPPLAR